MSGILILTDAADLHAIAVAEALTLRGAVATVWSTSDFPSRSEETLHYLPSLRDASLRIQTPEFSLADPEFAVVWRRRPSYVIDSNLAHPSDFAFAERECGVFRRAFFNLLSPRAFWVNQVEPAARAGNKLMQHGAALRVGLKMPETIYTNSPREVRMFIRAKEGRVIYKPFLPAAWSDGIHHWMPYTAQVSGESLADDSIRLTPGIFQELIPKAYEVRITVMGRRAFAAKILSQDTVSGRLDWRQAYNELRFEPIRVPPDIEAKCVALLEEMGLVFGCFDFIVDPNGEYIFLEVNEMGQFLFVERYCGIPLLDAFTSFLLQARIDFEWSEEEVLVRYTDPGFDARVLERSEAFAKAHVAVPAKFNQE